VFAVSCFEVIYKNFIEKPVVAHGGGMGRLSWPTAVGLTAVAHAGRRAPRRLVVKTDKFSNGRIFWKMN
jgi:hypothetical protein